jgi:hypothetical protein
MKQILGTDYNYHDQTNDGSYNLLKDYSAKSKAISCYPNAFAGGLEIGQWPDVFTPGEQWPDSILMILHSGTNLSKWKAIRNLDYDKYPPNEIPQLYGWPGLPKVLYGDKGNSIVFKWGISFDIIVNAIKNKTCLHVAGKFPAGPHGVLITGYDDDREIIYYNDSYKKQYSDKKGYNRTMTKQWMEDNISDWRIEIPEYK